MFTINKINFEFTGKLAVAKGNLTNSVRVL